MLVNESSETTSLLLLHFLLLLPLSYLLRLVIESVGEDLHHEFEELSEGDDRESDPEADVTSHVGEEVHQLEKS